MECEMQPSPHAMDRKIERGVSDTEMSEAISRGVKRMSKKKIIALHKGLEVVYRKKPCHIFIITLYWR
jgi:hypothetical protein